MNFLRTLSLRQIILLDAVVTGINGVLLAAAANLLADLVGIAASELRLVGLILVPYAVFAALIGSRPSINRKGAWALVVINAIWAVDSIVILALGWITPTLLGSAYVVLQAAIVLAFAALQYGGLRQSVSKAV